MLHSLVNIRMSATQVWVKGKGQTPEGGDIAHFPQGGGTHVYLPEGPRIYESEAGEAGMECVTVVGRLHTLPPRPRLTNRSWGLLVGHPFWGYAQSTPFW